MAKDKIKEGWHCKKNENGEQECTRMEQHPDGKKLPTGTKVTIGHDDRCNPVFTGDVNEFMDEDEAQINKIANRATAGCRAIKGMQ